MRTSVSEHCPVGSVDTSGMDGKWPGPHPVPEEDRGAAGLLLSEEVLGFLC